MADMAIIGPLLPASRKPVMPFSYGLDDVIAADTVTRSKVPWLHLVFGRESDNKNDVQHVIIESHFFCTHFCGKLFDPAHRF